MYCFYFDFRCDTQYTILCVCVDDSVHLHLQVASTSIRTPGPISTKPKRVLEPPLSMPFVLPQNYSPAVSEGLKHGSLTGKAMVKFITEISHALFSFKSYPTAEERDHVARQCVKKFTFLEASSGTGYVS